MRISVKHSLDDVLLQKEGLMLEMIARCSSCGSVDNMLKEEALVLVHNAIIDGLFDNLVSFGKEAFELFMQCYGQDIVTIHKTSDELTQLFKTGLVFGVRRDDNMTIVCNR